jgi:hypothetical protein
MNGRKGEWRKGGKEERRMEERRKGKRRKEGDTVCYHGLCVAPGRRANKSVYQMTLFGAMRGLTFHLIWTSTNRSPAKNLTHPLKSGRRREKGEGRREKGEGEKERREKGEGRRKKVKGGRGGRGYFLTGERSSKGIVGADHQGGFIGYW